MADGATPLMSASVATVDLFNNLWVVICGALVFIMTISVGILERGELGRAANRALLKNIMISCSGFFFMAFLGYNVAFAPTIGYGLMGNPLYNFPFMGSFASNSADTFSQVWWSMGPQYFNNFVTLPSYYFFETAFATVTLALVGVIVLRKMKLKAFFLYSIPYFIIIWALPAAWIWNPQGWLYVLGVRDFAGGLIVHGAAGAAGLAIVLRVWQEEKKKGFTASPQIQPKPNTSWLALSILLLWLGWFGFNPGSTLALNIQSYIVIVITFLAAATGFLFTMFFKYLEIRKMPSIMYAANGVLIGLIVITPVAGYVGPESAIILGILGSLLFILGEKLFQRAKWFTDPVGLFPGHFLGGIFGFVMVAFFTQKSYADFGGGYGLSNGILFGGGMAAVRQLGLQLLAIPIVVITVFVLSYIFMWMISKGIHGIINEYPAEISSKRELEPSASG
jgi:Amt family ammonium transporter